MAKLQRAVKDGHYYIRKPAWPGAPPNTYQVSEAGIEYLRQKGKDEGSDIPNGLFEILRDSGYLFTGGSGAATTSITSKQPPPPIPSPNYNALQLSVRCKDLDWQLNVLFPEVKPEWTADIETLSHCSFVIEGEILPAIKLWPGKGGAYLPVQPHSNDYKIVSNGPWPSKWDIRGWIGSLDGLNGTGTLFHSEDNGLRLGKKEGLLPGNHYYLALHKDNIRLKNQSGSRLPPQSLNPVPLQSQSDWFMWEVVIPEVLDQELINWSEIIGHPVLEPAATLFLISPPPVAYTTYNIPCIHARQAIILGVEFPVNASWLGGSIKILLTDLNAEKTASTLSIPSDEGRKYIKFTLEKPGLYRIRCDDGRIKPLTFKVIPPSNSLDFIEYPSSLLADFITEQNVFSFHAYDQKGEVVIQSNQLDSSHPVQVRLASLVPVSVIIRRPQDSIERLNLSAPDAAELIASELADAVKASHRIFFELNAGTFGRLRFNIETPLTEVLPRAELPLSLELQLRRLAIILSGISVSQDRSRTVMIPPKITSILRQFCNNYPVFSDLKYIHADYLSYAISVGRAIDRASSTDNPVKP